MTLVLTNLDLSGMKNHIQFGYSKACFKLLNTGAAAVGKLCMMNVVVTAIFIQKVLPYEMHSFLWSCPEKDGGIKIEPKIFP